MTLYTISNIIHITNGVLLQGNSEVTILHLLTDSRRLIHPSTTLFVSLTGKGRSGLDYLLNCYQSGVRNFLVSEKNASLFAAMPEANIIWVEHSLTALQQLSANHRAQFSLPVIGITGSNGKTIIKEWLFQLLHSNYQIVRSPKSYNSQIGVPLSVWQINPAHNLAIFEAGISEVGEMIQLEKIIRPNIGILSHMGDAHASGFTSFSQKIQEKLLLFRESEVLIYSSQNSKVVDEVNQYKKICNNTLFLFSVGKNNDDDVQILSHETDASTTILKIRTNDAISDFRLPFTDAASVENALICIATLIYLNKTTSFIQAGLNELKSLEMRLELKQGNHQCILINDSYSNDLDSLQIALDFLSHQASHFNKTIVLSDFADIGLSDKKEFYAGIAQLLHQKGIQRFIGVGPELLSHASSFKQIPNLLFFESTEKLMHALTQIGFNQEAILIKGARKFQLEKLLHHLEQKRHETVLEIDLNAIRSNLRKCRELLLPGVKIMAMVKAFGYGSGSHEISSLLQFEGVDYLAVAYADEGIELRKAGIQLPILVLNPNPSEFEWLIQYHLEPEIYSLQQWKQWESFVQTQSVNNHPIHIKLDTGMHRLGFQPEAFNVWMEAFQKNPCAHIRSVFSHLVASEDENEDIYTKEQGAQFYAMASQLEHTIGYTVIKHLGNSAAIHRHHDLQFDMVRFGIGLYGIGSMPGLQPVATLKTTICQIKQLKKGDTVGYNRKGVLMRDGIVGTVRIGYADGYPRILGNGNGSMWVNGKLAPVIGNVCMDMTMLDLTGIDAKVGDEVIVFGAHCPVDQVAQWANTIPYEILAGIAQRVKRIYFES